MKFFENFKQGKVTTFIGFLLMAASVYVYLKEGTGSEVFALALLTFGAVAFGIKDPKLPGTGAVMLAMVALLSLQGCVTYTKCFDKFGSIAKDSVKITVRVPYIDTVRVEIPGDTLQGTLNDSILNLLRSHSNDTIRETSESGKLQIKFWYDKFRRELEYRATLKPDTIVKIVKDTVSVVADCPPAVVFNPLQGLSWYAPASLWDRFKLFAAWLVLVEVLALAVYSKLHAR